MSKDLEGHNYFFIVPELPWHEDEHWNKCDKCGRFISFEDFDNGSAIRVLVTPDSEFTAETYETLCKEHNCNHRKYIEMVWLTDEIEGFRCKNCGKEFIDPEEFE